MKTPKRLFSVLVSGALVLSLTTLPSGAVQSSFSDITDPATAVNADILRLTGVVSGTGGNLFDPGGVLSRAQFCTMAVNFLQKGEEAPRYATRTIFSDVKSGTGPAATSTWPPLTPPSLSRRGAGRTARASL